MKKLLLFFLTIISCYANAQKLNRNLNKDSLFELSIKGLPQNLKDTLVREYALSSEQGKEFMLFMVSMPRTSKEIMIRNIDSNYARVLHLKSEYAKLVPRNYKVQIEFEPANANFGISESIDLRITKNDGAEETVSQDWQLEYHSEKLKKMLQTIHWNQQTLDRIKLLLQNANCISIENGEPAEIGFGRSGLGEYSYFIFSHNLTNEEAKRHTDGCNQIFYKNNIVLEYQGGAAGPQCFPDR